jgi:hypothetical protein
VGFQEDTIHGNHGSNLGIPILNFKNMMEMLDIIITNIVYARLLTIIGPFTIFI